MMTTIDRHDALTAALRAARENEQRWMELSPDPSADGERMEQWRSVARLRRLEVERIEALLAQMIEHRGKPQPDRLDNAVARSESAGIPRLDESPT